MNRLPQWEADLLSNAAGVDACLATVRENTQGVDENKKEFGETQNPINWRKTGMSRGNCANKELGIAIVTVTVSSSLAEDR